MTSSAPKKLPTTHFSPCTCFRPRLMHLLHHNCASMLAAVPFNRDFFRLAKVIHYDLLTTYVCRAMEAISSACQVQEGSTQ